MHTILEHFRSALCNLKKGGIDLSLNKWVELVSPVSYTHLDVYKRQDRMGNQFIMGRERFCKTTTVRCQLILWLLEPAVSE